jgi:hypothetical protein
MILMFAQIMVLVIRQILVHVIQNGTELLAQFQVAMETYQMIQVFV